MSEQEKRLYADHRMQYWLAKANIWIEKYGKVNEKYELKALYWCDRFNKLAGLIETQS